MKFLSSSLRKPKKFITTLYDILNDSQNTETIAWTESGDSFAILDLHGLSSKILPTYFKHRNSSSFIRQLNMYDFHKIRDTGEVLVFKHRFFLRDDPDQLVKVSRKMLNVSHKKDNSEKKVFQLKRKLSGLKQKVESLSVQMDEMLKINRVLKDELSKFSEREKKFDQILALALKEGKGNPNDLTGFNSIGFNPFLMNPMYYHGFSNNHL